MLKELAKPMASHGETGLFPGALSRCKRLTAEISMTIYITALN